MNRKRKTPRRGTPGNRIAWNVYHSDPLIAADRVVRTRLSEAAARATARALNLGLTARGGLPVRLPCEFYYAQHGNSRESERDAGLNAWIDDGHPEADREDAA